MSNFSSSFTGNNGDPPPSPWSVVSGAASIQNNYLQIASPAVQWNAGEVRANQTVSDFKVVVKLKVATITNNSPRINFRWDPATGNGYRLIVGNEYDEITLLKVVNFAETTVATAALGLAPNTDYWVSVDANGSVLNVKRWADGSGEPGSPTLQATDSTYTSGDISLVTVTAAAAVATSTWSTFSLVDYVNPIPPDLPTDFTGSDGDPWPLPWTSVSGTNVINSNRGQQTTAGVAFDTARARANKSYTDQRYDARFQVPTIANGAMVLDVHSDGSGGAGYRLIIGTSYTQIQPFRVSAFAESALVGPKSMSFLANTWYRVATETNNGLIRFKVWLESDSEPSAWDFTIYDTTYTSGDILLGTKTLSGSAMTAYWDDISVGAPYADGASPTAIISDPTPTGQTAGYEHVRGLVTLSGSGSDDIVVAHLAFYDGDPTAGGSIIGTVNTMPYAVVWDTTATSNGLHQLYAVAVDIANNSGVSAPVSVVVNNSGIWAPDASRCWPVSVVP